MSVTAHHPRRRARPWVFYLTALAGALVLPTMGRLGQFMGEFGVAFYGLCLFAVLIWIGLFCWLAWRRTDEVARAAQKTAWAHGATAGGILALAAVMVAFLLAVQQTLTMRFITTHPPEAAAGQVWNQTLKLSTGEPHTERRVTSTWEIQGDDRIELFLGVVFGQGMAAGVLLTLLLQILGFAVVWGGWWGRIWGSSSEDRK